MISLVRCPCNGSGRQQHSVQRILINGRRRDIGLGPYPLVSLAFARMECTKADFAVMEMSLGHVAGSVVVNAYARGVDRQTSRADGCLGPICGRGGRCRCRLMAR